MIPNALVRIVVAMLVAVALLPQMAAAATHMVTVGDNFFSPSSLTIQVGDTVQWNNASGGNAHNVTANNGSFASGTSSSFTFSRTFNSAGTFGYQCTIHSGMNGSITVQSDGGGSADLAVQSVNATNGTYAPGDAISVAVSIQNVGNAASSAYTVRIYASTNSTINGSDTEIGSSARAALAAGQMSNFNVNGTFPGNIADGNYFIGALIEINDSNNANNTGHDQTAITVTTPAGNTFEINNGLNDAWFNPDTDGQGFFVIVFPVIHKMFLSMFTYDVERPPGNVTALLGEPGHRWLTAFGDYSGDTAVLAIDLTQGGVFDSHDPVPTHDPTYGTFTVTFTDCHTGEVSYNIPSASQAGVVPIQRITNDNVPLCEEQQPP